MGSFYKDLEAAAQALGEEVAERAYAAARYKVQEDFNKELVPYVAKMTGHNNLAATVFAEVQLNSRNDLNVDMYTEEGYVAGLFQSKSSYHPGYEGWQEVSKFKSMTRSQFWAMRLSGEDEDHGTYGGIEADWVTDNFWKGIQYVTNGWPLGGAEMLEVWTENEDVSGEEAVSAYISKYTSDGRYAAHIQEAINDITG